MKLMTMLDIYFVFKKIDEIQEMLTAERGINETNLVQNITEELIVLA